MGFLYREHLQQKIDYYPGSGQLCLTPVKADGQVHMWPGLRSYVFLVSVALLALGAAITACGSESPGAASDQSVASSGAEEPGTSLILNIDDTYSMADFEAAGYKKVTQFDLDTLPEATDAWIGFFNQRDIEIRFYPSHQMALDMGVEPAEIAIGKGAVPWQKRPPVRFDGYVVAGNVVMLCELEIASCEALITQTVQMAQAN